MRMTRQTRAILEEMLGDPGAEHYGLELARTVGLVNGTIYPLLARLDRNRWVESGWESIDPKQAGRPRRRYYKLTSLGLERAGALRLGPVEATQPQRARGGVDPGRRHGPQPT
jgi:PadR family transcriptional regulator, regulatory protein PadR